MKIKGRKLSKLNEKILVFERNGLDEDGNPVEDIVFTLRPVEDFEDFSKLCPEPKPGIKILKGGVRQEDTGNPNYIKAMNVYHNKQINYVLIHSLLATEGLEFETVKLDDPETWNEIATELSEILFSAEIFALYEACTSVNAVSEESLDRARNRFLASQRQKEMLQSSQTTEQESTPSGEPANDSESSLPGATLSGTTTDGDTKPATSSSPTSP